MGINTKTSLIWLKMIKLCPFLEISTNLRQILGFHFFGRHRAIVWPIFLKEVSNCSEKHAASNKTCRYCIWNITLFSPLYSPPLIITLVDYVVSNFLLWCVLFCCFKGTRNRRASSSRRFHYAPCRVWQYKCTVYNDRRKGSGSHQNGFKMIYQQL